MKIVWAVLLSLAALTGLAFVVTAIGMIVAIFAGISTESPSFDLAVRCFFGSAASLGLIAFICFIVAGIDGIILTNTK